MLASSQRVARAIFYGGASTILALDLFFLFRAVFTTNFVPILPIFVGILTAAGILIILHSEQRARDEDARDHRRISRVAHQLTNPLKVLQTELDQLILSADELPAEQRLQLKKMATKSDVLLENIRDVFLTLQAQEGRISQNIRAYDTCTLVQEAVDRANNLASAKNVKLVLKAHCPDASAKVDRQLFLLVLAHVLENAITYTRTPGLVNIAVAKGKTKVRIIIQDRGIGIKRDEVHLIDRPFARGSEAEKYDPDGIGLGIALSHLIIKEFRGHLTWHSRPNRAGSEFVIHLPLLKKD